MITENLLTLKIHKLTQEQYDRELAAGRIDETALYLTPDEEIDLTPYATVEQLNGKADTEHTHEISDVTGLQASLEELESKITNQGTESTVGVYVQDEEPTDASEGSIWIDTDEEGLSSTTKTTANVYIVDAATTDVATVDFSKYAIGDVVVVTTS